MTGNLRVDLSSVSKDDGLEFRFAEVWGDVPSLALVAVAARGWADIKLRLDLYKRVFIDHVSDGRVNSYVDSRAKDVWEKIVQARN